MEQSNEIWDLIVVGGGTAGIVAAKTASQLGARVLLVERHKTGGDCLWTGCVPSKSLLAAAHLVAQVKAGANMGISVAGVRVNFPAVMNAVKSKINEIAPEDSPSALWSAGISVIQGNVLFTSPKSLSIDEQNYRFAKAIIATGATPAVPPIPGLRESKYLTSENIWELAELPEKLVVLGAGSIGCELGQAFSRLGAQVTLIEGAERILPREDESAAELLEDRLTSEGITIRTLAKVNGVETDLHGAGQILFDSPAFGVEKIAFDRILIAIGRTPRTSGLGLEKAGVEISPHGFVVTSKSLRTTNRSIWAAGDVTGNPQFTHVAGVHGSVASSNALLGINRKAELTTIPRVTYTDPEIAAVGVATTTKNPKLRVLEYHNNEVDRAITDSKKDGMTKLVVDAKGRIVGGLAVGPRGGEVLSEITLAVRMGLTTRNLAATIHPYPTYADGIWNIAVADIRNQLQEPRMQFALKVLKKIQRLKDIPHRREGRS